MFELSTDRLRIIQLDEENFKLLLNNRRKMESNLGVFTSGYELDSGYIEAMKMVLENVLKNINYFQWYTDWQIVLKSENKIIGSVGFKGKPNENGEVEIGYGLNENYERKGFMTEAVRHMVRWALEQKGIKHVIAETEIDNIASQKVLKKNGFIAYKNENNCIWWKFSISL